MNLKRILASTLVLGCLATTSVPVFAESESRPTSFIDLEGHWGKDYILDAVDRKLFFGKTSEIFDPEADITRAEFIVVMTSLLDAPVEPIEPGDDWYKGYFDVAKSWMIIPSDFTLETMNQPITREEMACVLVMTVGEYMFPPQEGNSQNIADYDEVSPEYASYVSMALEAKLMNGKLESKFDPVGKATRAEAAAVVLAAANKYFAEPVEFDNELCETYSLAIHKVQENYEMQVPTVSSVTDFMWQMLQPQLLLESDDIEGFSIAYSAMNVQAYCVAVIKPAEGKLDNVLAGLEHYHGIEVSNYTNYLMDQLEIVEAAITKTLDDGTVLFVMAPDAEEMAEALVQELS